MSPFYSTILGQWYVGHEDSTPITGPFDTRDEAQAFIDNAAGARMSDDLDRAVAMLDRRDNHSGSRHWVHLAGQS